MRKILFTVDKLEFVGSGKFMVAGRNCEDDLRKGDILKVENGAELESIEVVVDEMIMYNKKVAEVPTGFTAGLFLDNKYASFFRLGGTLKSIEKE